MLWNELYHKDNQPSKQQINSFVNTPLFDLLDEHLQQTHHVKPQLFYSGCSMDQGFWEGWNIKYKKSGKSLCTVYPKQGYFAVLLAVSNNEKEQAELLIPFCDDYTQTVYKNTKSGKVGMSLPLEVTSEAILKDVISLITVRTNKRNA